MRFYLVVFFIVVSCMPIRDQKASLQSLDWEDFFVGEDVEELLFGVEGDKNTLIAAVTHSSVIQDQRQLELSAELPLNLTKQAAKSLSKRVGKGVDPKIVKRMAGIELNASIKIQYRKSIELVIKTTQPLAGNAFIKRNGINYLNMIRGRDQIIYCLQKLKINRVLSAGAEFDLVVVGAEGDISRSEFSEIELFSGMIPPRENVPIKIYEKLCSGPFSKKAMELIQPNIADAVAKFYKLSPDAQACIVPAPDDPDYLESGKFKSAEEFLEYRKVHDDPGCEYRRQDWQNPLLYKVTGVPVYRCIPQGNGDIGLCEYRRTKEQRCNIYVDNANNVTTDQDSGSLMSIWDMKPCDKVRGLECVVNQETGFLGVLRGYTGRCR